MPPVGVKHGVMLFPLQLVLVPERDGVHADCAVGVLLDQADMHRIHRNNGTWRDIGSALIIFAHCLLLTGDSADGFPPTLALNGPARARSMKPREVSAGPLPLTRPRHGRESTCSISLTCQMKNSAMSSTPPPEVSCVKQRRFQRLSSAKKA